MKDRLIEPATHVGTAVHPCPVERRSTIFVSVGLRATIRRGITQLKSLPPILAATLREIFDESAYARFLKQRQLVSSRAAYAAFRQEHEVAKARRPRCC